MTKFVFDLDGTITKVETLPLLAKELNLSEEIRLLTDLTMSGKISFEKSFRLRHFVLRNIPPKKIFEIMQSVPLDEEIAGFIRANKKNCVAVTGNLDAWIEPIIKKLGCDFFSSESEPDENGIPLLKKILDKGEVVREMKRKNFSVVAIGDGANDLPMFDAADFSVAYGGVHRPPDFLIRAANYFVTDGKNLCDLLKNFCR